jgi:hypothetical protein
MSRGRGVRVGANLFAMSLLRTVVFGALSLLLPSLAAATLVQAIDLAEMASRSDRIVVAEVQSVESEWDSSHRTIRTRFEVKVEEVWKGAPAERLIIDQPGGTVGDVEMKVHGMPTFEVGEKAVLFLSGQSAHRVVGMSQGKRSLRWDGGAKRWMADSAEHSAVVRRDFRGRLLPVQPEPALGLDQLRQQVQALVKP